MRFNIREMKKQGIFMGILAAFLALVICISYVTSIIPSAPAEEPEPEQTETQQGTSSKPTVETPKPHTHKWSKGSTVKATCTEGGYTINTCSCGQSKTTNETVALGHKLGEWETAEPDEEGVVYKTRKCENCDFYEKQKVGNEETEKPEDPENPENPEDPENPDTPENPGDDGEDDGEKGDDEDENKNPNPETNPEQGGENQ